MKQMKTWLQHLRQCCALKGRKAGSSLGMVMIVGTALVIWVMAIMPLMTTTGTTAIKTQNTQAEYLSSRSAIEFSKSELEKIVETEIPYTFAVLKDDTGKFSALPKKDGIITNPDYQACIVENATDDTKDVPEAGDAGANVAAICAAKLNPEDTTQYLLTITTFNKGEKDLSYTAIYTLSGSLLIYPESYKQSQALPLSDFVLVDGKLGANQVWDSTITGPGASGYTETLLPFVLEPEGNYADSGRYPSVFKTTALASEDGESIGEAIKEDDLTDMKWIMPSASTKEAADKMEGSMWIDVSGSSAQVYMLLDGENTLITDKCTIYYNGTERTTYPSATGKYTIAVDYEGTGDYDKTENAVNVLPIDGVLLGSYEVSSGKFDASDCEIEDIEYWNGACTVELTKVLGARYGYTTNPDGSDITWGSSHQLYLTADETYYFYCYCPAQFVEGKWYEDSDVKYVGMIFPFDAVTSLDDGDEYIVMAEQNEKYYSWTTSLADEEYPRSNPAEFKGELNQGVILADPDEDLAWTMVKTSPQNTNSTWRFVSEGEFVNGEFEAEDVLRVTQNRSGSGINSNKYEYSYSVSTGSASNSSGRKYDFEISINQENGRAKATLTYQEKEKWHSASKNVSVYLGYNNDFVADKNERSLYFIKVPAAGAETIPTPVSYGDYSINVSFTYDQNNDNLTKIQNLIMQETGNMVNPERIYVNGDRLTDGEVLDVGTYDLVGYVSDDDLQLGEEYYKLGTLTVSKAILTADEYSITLMQDSADELKIKMTGENWHGETGGISYLGYKVVTEEETESEVNWVIPTDGTFDFRLDYGEYIFIMAESGSLNYSLNSYKQTDVFEIKAAYVSLTEDDKSKFVYGLDRSKIQDIKATWYELPDKIMPSKITMAYGIPTDDGAILWSEDYTSEVRFYGAMIKGTDYETLDNVFQLSQPLAVTNVNGRFSSMLRGSSMYFVGEDASINTFGNDIYLTTDLLVLKNETPIVGGGRVIVNPYSIGDDAPGNTLVFFVDDVKKENTQTGAVEVIFEGKNFYLVPPGKDINNVSATVAAGWKCVDDYGNGTQGTNFIDDVKYFFRNKVYPEIKLDIAYATEEQLNRIVSGETIGWTNKGKLSGSAPTEYNYEYVVCAYVNQVNGSIEYNANRILIAAQELDADGKVTSDTLTVPADIKFTTRYLSVEANNIVQGNSGVNFELYNLAQDEDFLDYLVSIFGFYNTISKTLQMDYERYTKIIYADMSERPIEAQIYRYDHGTDIFAATTAEEELMAPYTTNEVDNLFTNWLTSTVKIVDRYVSLSKGSKEFDVSSLAGSKLNIYANYLYIDSSVSTIKLAGLLSSGDIIINTQESGYTTENEYLSLFETYGSESYSGTILYCARAVKVTYSYWRDPAIMPAGFYKIDAEPGGTSLITIAKNAEDYKITTDELKDSAVYIDPQTGKISNAYVDTGIYDNDSVGLGGFSGGSMK